MARPYIVLLGDVGVGKSTLVEKLTGKKGMSSSSSESFTRVSVLYESFDGKLDICDTPGTNSLKDRFEHNCNIAHALNYAPVSRILVIVKADTRIANVVSSVKDYACNFLPQELPFDLLSVCVTHMDMVKWEKDELLNALSENLGITTVVVSSLNTTGAELQKDLLEECAFKKAVKLTIDSEDFLKIFNIGGNQIKILRFIKKEVGRFVMKKNHFHKIVKQNWSAKEKMDMTFEFQAWMFEEITKSQKELAKKFNFDFLSGPNIAAEAGHVANLTNQLRKVLSDVRVESMRYHKNVDSNFKSCPWCGEVWQKIQGCDYTTCGNRVDDAKASDQWSGGVTFHFAFIWDSKHEKLVVKQKESDELKMDNINWKYGKRVAGCGKSIVWSNMTPVDAPAELDIIDLASTRDVNILQVEDLPTWKQYFDFVMSKLPKLKRRT